MSDPTVMKVKRKRAFDGFIEYNGGLKVNHSLLTVIVHDSRMQRYGSLERMFKSALRCRDRVA